MTSARWIVLGALAVTALAGCESAQDETRKLSEQPPSVELRTSESAAPPTRGVPAAAPQRPESQGSEAQKQD